MALNTSAEQPAPVRTVAEAISGYVDRLGAVWVEGQIAQLTVRPGSRAAWLVLRDTDVAMSLSVVADVRVLRAVEPAPAEGHRVVVHAKPEFWTGSGRLQLRAREIRPVGLGRLLAELQRLKALLAAEGLFAPGRKKPLPFLPRVVGLVTGRASAAMHDVVVNATARWPQVRFEVREVPVQGPQAAAAVTGAVAELDGLAEVDVIVVARGGGSAEDLLPFSSETLVRAVAACRTPVVSAIGHEEDTPLLDFVADLRASTPTDAAKRIVPDVAEERRRVADALGRCRNAVVTRVRAERSWLETLRTRPALADPASALERRRAEVSDLHRRSWMAHAARVARARDDVSHVRARVRALSPQATLDRGYAVAQHADGRVVRDAVEVGGGEPLRLRLARGELGVRAEGRPPGGGPQDRGPQDRGPQDRGPQDRGPRDGGA